MLEYYLESRELQELDEGEDESEDFTGSGKCYDEITFVFDDGKKLYVSQNFLHNASPVLQAMFENDWKEKESKTVKLPGKNYDDFLEFLLCLHPNKQSPVNNANVLRVASIADEYQSTLLMKKCKDAMLNWLSTAEGKCKSSRFDEVATAASVCYQILIKADSLNYHAVVKGAVPSISRFPYKWFTGTPKGYSASKSTEDILLNCKILYSSLSDKLKVRLLSERLNNCDKSKYHDS